ncbi:MAG: alanyl-tRNA editing protein AlaXM [Candidatus Bathyarchaeia archaeon]
MTRALYLEDSYLKECEAVVASVKDGKYVILDQTVFYPKGGGQPCDTGKIIRGNEVYKIVYVGKFSGEISHEVDHAGLKQGERVQCIIDWDRRYRLMRSHTAAHLFASLLCNGTGALVTGNQLETDKIRFDFSLEQFNPDLLQKYVDETNQLLSKDVPVKSYELPREEALKIPGVVKMAEAFPPDIPRLRVVELVNLDKQADGGTHVRNLNEVGRITLLKTENKGKNNRRIYFTLTP